jgi:hypothetical protein
MTTQAEEQTSQQLAANTGGQAMLPENRQERGAASFKLVWGALMRLLCLIATSSSTSSSPSADSCRTAV